MPWIAPTIGLAANYLFAGDSKRSGNAAADAITQSAQGPRYTNYGSSVLRAGNNNSVTIDPRIRAMREQGLANLPGYRSQYQTASDTLNQGLGQVTGGYSDMLSRLSGNQNPFMQARVNPLLASAAQSRGQLVSGLTNRGLGGSSFFGQSLSNFEDATGRRIGDAGALATQESLAAQNQGLAGLGAAYGNQFAGQQAGIMGQQSIDKAYTDIAQMNLEQELKALGLSTPDTGAITDAAKARLFGQQNANDAWARGISGVGDALTKYNNMPTPDYDPGVGQGSPTDYGFSPSILPNSYKFSG